MMLYFKLEEFQCPCCGKELMDAVFLDRLDKLRGSVGHPLIVNSGFRCPKHNAEKDGSKESMHLKGMASDISTTNMTAGQRHRLINQAMELFNGIGIGKNFVHVDIRKEPAMWVY